MKTADQIADDKWMRLAILQEMRLLTLQQVVAVMQELTTDARQMELYKTQIPVVSATVLVMRIIDRLHQVAS